MPRLETGSGKFFPDHFLTFCPQRFGRITGVGIVMPRHAKTGLVA
ncbi:hypothetical protein [Komagataeibacter xylinus]|nr:hypothetical protein [Komagataeibacter xylinus]